MGKLFNKFVFRLNRLYKKSFQKYNYLSPSKRNRIESFKNILATNRITNIYD